MRELQNLSVTRHHDDDLLEFKLAFEKNVLQLENLKPNYTSSQYFLEALISKLPVETFRALAIRYQCAKFMYKQVSDDLTKMIDLMERCKFQPQNNRKSEAVSKVTVESKSQSRNISKSMQKKGSGNRSQSNAQSMKKVAASTQSSNLCVIAVNIRVQSIVPITPPLKVDEIVCVNLICVLFV